MDRPRVTVHNLISLDGCLGGFPADAGLYYELASAFSHDAILTGSATLLAAAARQGVDMSREDPPPPPAAATPAGGGSAASPLLVIVDSRGMITRYTWLREQPFWRDVLVLCSRATPAGHLGLLRRQGVGHLLCGDRQVDLAAALAALATRHQVTAVRVDAGGVLNRALLAAVERLRQGHLWLRYAVRGPATAKSPAA